jgi:hypothetical protein
MTKHHKFNAHTLWLREAWIYEYATFPEKKTAWPHEPDVIDGDWLDGADTKIAKPQLGSNKKSSIVTFAESHAERFFLENSQCSGVDVACRQDFAAAHCIADLLRRSAIHSADEKIIYTWVLVARLSFHRRCTELWGCAAALNEATASLVAN